MKTPLFLLFSLLLFTGCEGAGGGTGAPSGGATASTSTHATTVVVPTVTPACQGKDFVGQWSNLQWAPLGYTPRRDDFEITENCEIKSTFCGPWYSTNTSIEFRSFDSGTQVSQVRITMPNAGANGLCFQPGTSDCDLFTFFDGGLNKTVLSITCPGQTQKVWFK